MRYWGKVGDISGRLPLQQNSFELSSGVGIRQRPFSFLTGSGLVACNADRYARVFELLTAERTDAVGYDDGETSSLREFHILRP